MTKLIFLGKLSDLTPQRDLSPKDKAGLTCVGDLRAYLREEYGAALDWTSSHVKIAVDGVLAREDTPIAGAKEIALMPPVGGG